MLNLILKLVIISFICFLDTKANETIYTVKDNEVLLQNDQNVLELREQAKKIAFEKAFNILTKKILEPSELRKLDRVGEIDISILIKDFKIVEEKITDINYSSNITVNFNQDLISNFFETLDVKSKVLVSEEYLVFPVFKKFNTFYLWENDNYWYDSLLDEYDELGLLKLFFPKKNHINKLRISAKDLIDEDVMSVKNFLELHNKKKAIIIILEENYNLELNKHESFVFAKLFSSNRFDDIKLFQKGTYTESSEFSNVKLISKLIINELQEWWKNQIDSIKFESEEEITFFIKLETADLKNNILIERKINKILGKKGFNIHELDNTYITYKVKTKYSIDQLNLALEVDDFRLIELEEDKNYFMLESY